MKIFLSHILLILVTGGLFYPAFAQFDELHEGQEIRILAPQISKDSLRGIILSISTSELFLQTAVDSLEIPLGYIDYFSVRKQQRRTGKGALVGAGIGGFIVGIAAMSSYSSCNEDEFLCMDDMLSKGELFLGGALLGGLGGGLIGAAIGSTIVQEYWQPLSLQEEAPPLTVHIINSAHTPGITFRWSF